MWSDRYGLSSYLDLVTAPDLGDDTLTVAAVRDQHLRVTNGSEEDAYIASLITTSYELAERVTWRALLTQVWALVLDRFPYGEIVIPLPPLQTVDAITYVDEDGAPQTLSASLYQVSAPQGPKARKGRIRPAFNETWPTTRCQMDAVRVEFTAGYVALGSPAVPDIPADIDHGRLLVIGELYKQRSESVHAFNQNPSVIRANDIWKRYRAW